MSMLYKRPDSPHWYVTKTRESTKTSSRKLAEEFARKSITAHWRSEALGEEIRTWETLAEDWLDIKDGRASFEQDRMVIERFGETLTRREIKRLDEIDADVVADYARVVKATHTAATANRHLTTIRAMLNRAESKRWIDRAPNVENYQVAKNEVKPLTIEQFNSILPHLPEWVADMATFAVQTGMRYSNVAGLEWSWISADGGVVVVPAIHTKSARTYTVPLSGLAKAIIAKRRKAMVDKRYVFVGKKRVRPEEYVDCAPVPTIRYWWEAAREAAGFPDVRWHDLRHTWASLHVQNNTPDRILMQMGGWSSPRMLENYAHLATEHLTAYADNLNGK